MDFLAFNGFVLTPSEAEQIDTVWKVAASEITEAEFAAWVERGIKPL